MQDQIQMYDLIPEHKQPIRSLIMQRAAVLRKNGVEAKQAHHMATEEMAKSLKQPVTAHELGIFLTEEARKKASEVRAGKPGVKTIMKLRTEENPIVSSQPAPAAEDPFAPTKEDRFILSLTSALKNLRIGFVQKVTFMDEEDCTFAMGLGIWQKVSVQLNWPKYKMSSTALIKQVGNSLFVKRLK